MHAREDLTEEEATHMLEKISRRKRITRAQGRKRPHAHLRGSRGERGHTLEGSREGLRGILSDRLLREKRKRGGKKALKVNLLYPLLIYFGLKPMLFGLLLYLGLKPML